MIESENWNEDDYEKEISILEDLVKEYINTFDDVLPRYGTNIIESFNHCREMLCNKNMALRLSWRVRCYISIIKWNSPMWEQQIFQRSNLHVPKEVIEYEEKVNEEKEKRREIQSTDAFKINNAKKKKLRKEKYKLNKGEQMVHNDAEEDDDSSSDSQKSVKKRKVKSKKSNANETEEWIFEALHSLTKTTNQFISFKRIYENVVIFSRKRIEKYYKIFNFF